MCFTHRMDAAHLIAQFQLASHPPGVCLAITVARQRSRAEGDDRTPPNRKRKQRGCWLSLNEETSPKDCPGSPLGGGNGNDAVSSDTVLMSEWSERYLWYCVTTAFASLSVASLH